MATKNFPTLYKLADNGGLIEWTICVEQHERPIGTMASVIISRWGQQGGKFQETREAISEGKNFGKKNETTPFEQACKDAQSKWEKQQKAKKYVTDPTAALAGERSSLVEGGIDPMLAFPREKKPKALKFPCDDQPKLDGIRCETEVKGEGGVISVAQWSRTRKPISSMPHIVAALKKHFKDLVDRGLLSTDFVFWTDGELYFHDLDRVPAEWLANYPNPKMAKFQYISHLVATKGEPDPDHAKVEYHIYDTSSEDEWQCRRAWLKTKFHNAKLPLVLVETRPAADEEELAAHEEEYVSLGYEGLMARNLAGKYTGKRTPDLLKVKRFVDSEFEVARVETETRIVTDSGGTREMVYARFICKLDGWTKHGDEDHEFGSTLNASQEIQRSFLGDTNAYVGKLLTVKYQGLTADNKPRFPKGLRFREDL